MSHITFSADLNSSKLDAAIKQSNKTVKEWAKDVERSSRNVDRSFTNLGKSLKQTIDEQKQYVKGLTKEVNNMQKAFDKATGGKAKSKLGQELGQAKRRLREATSELVGMQEEQIRVNNRETQSTKGLTSQIKDWALKLGGAAMAYRVLRQAIMATTIGINSFNLVGAVMKQVLYNLITGTTDLTTGIRNAIEAQKELNEYRLMEKVYTKASKLEQVLYDQAITKAHDQTLLGTERIEAYDKALEHLTNMTKLRKAAVQEEIDAVLKSRKYQEGDEKTLMRYADLQIELIDLDHRHWSAQKEVMSMRSGLIKSEEKAEEDKKKALEEAVKIENKLKKEQELLYKAIDENNEAEMKAIAERIVALQKELSLRKRIAEAAIGAAIVRETPIPKLPAPKIKTVGGISISNVLAPAPNIAKRKEILEAEKKAEEERIERNRELVRSAVEFTDQLVRQLSLTQEQADAIGFLADSAFKLASGDYTGAALGILSRVIGVFGQMRDVVSEPVWKKQIEAWDALLERQQKVIDNAARLGGVEAALIEAERLAQKQLDEMNAAVAQARERRGIPSQELLDALQQAREDLEDAQEALRDFYTGSLTEAGIAGAIARGFEAGESSAVDFADTFDDLMRDAINSSLEELSKPQITAWYKTFADFMKSGGGLDEVEKAKLKEEWDAIIASVAETRRAMYETAE